MRDGHNGYDPMMPGMLWAFLTIFTIYQTGGQAVSALLSSSPRPLQQHPTLASVQKGCT